MNCANHPEIEAAAYCQYCGKPLCTECMHKVNNIVSCESCLAARIGASANPIPGASSVPGAFPVGVQPQSWGREPWVAFLLGLIPGVGAMYNGQIAKGLAHVVIFALLVDLSNFNGALGILVAAWVFYQAFDAYQTTSALRDGLPLPNPLGLNDLGHWFGGRNHGQHSGTGPWSTYSGNPNAPTGQPTTSAPYGTEPVPPVPGFGTSYAPPPTPPIPPTPHDEHNRWQSGNHNIPVGAIVLVVLGIAFLLDNLGILSLHWFNHGWPILLIALGVWLVIRHRSMPPPTGGAQ